MEAQPIMYRLLHNSISKSTNVHAYLFETNDNKDAYEMIFDFIKTLFCPYRSSNTKDCVNCTQCERIENGNFSELKIIECDGNTIKKEQIDNLQKEFSNMSVETSLKIYLIKDIEKMTSSASNSMLKFLEEPEDNIIAIMTTSNRENVLSTIVSRCQVVSITNYVSYSNILELVADLNCTTETEKQVLIKDVELESKIAKVCLFVNALETDVSTAMVDESQIFNLFFKEKTDINLFYNIILAIYKSKLKSDTFDLNVKFKTENLNIICKKIENIIKYKKMSQENYNSNLLLDKFIIDMGMLE